MIKLVVCDFDGTLLPYDRLKLSEKTLQGLCTLSEKGIKLSVSSGRTYGELAEHFSTLLPDVYFICCDGAYCIYKDKTVYARHIEAEDLRWMFGISDPEFSMVLHAEKIDYSFGALPEEGKRFNCIPISGYYEIKERIYKITAYGKEIRLPSYSGLRLHWDGGENRCTQLVNRYCNKGAALSDLQTRLMLTKFDTACIGDSGNDVAMMKGAKYSYAVGNRCPELKNACGECFESCENVLDLIISNI